MNKGENHKDQAEKFVVNIRQEDVVTEKMREEQLDTQIVYVQNTIVEKDFHDKTEHYTILPAPIPHL